MCSESGGGRRLWPLAVALAVIRACRSLALRWSGSSQPKGGSRRGMVQPGVITTPQRSSHSALDPSLRTRASACIL